MSRKTFAWAPPPQKNGCSGKRKGRPVKNTCRALIPLDTEKIRKEYLKEYNRRKKVLDKLESDLQRFEESDDPEFQKFLAQTFGAEQTREREMAEKIRLCQSRYEKICFMAHENFMSKERYCFSLKGKITPELDFWHVLENELHEFQESGKRTRAEKKRDMEEAIKKALREQMGEALNDEDTGNCEDDDDFENFDADGDSFEDAFRKLMGNFFDDSAGELNDDESDGHNLKKLYRELCLRYHPDKIGVHDAKTKRLWIEIQEAYQDGDITRLRAIHAGIEIESGKSGLCCSDIDDMILDVEWSIQEKRDELRHCKKVPFWGFSAWTECKRRKIAKEIKIEYDDSHQQSARQLRQFEEELDRLMNSYKPKTKPPKAVKRKHKVTDQASDLFDDILAKG